MASHSNDPNRKNRWSAEEISRYDFFSCKGLLRHIKKSPFS